MGLTRLWVAPACVSKAACAAHPPHSKIFRTMPKLIRNFIAGQWRDSGSSSLLDVANPATAEVVGRVPLSTSDEVDTAVRAAAQAFPEWRRTPVTDRIQFLFKLKERLEAHFEELARLVTTECGKTL